MRKAIMVVVVAIFSSAFLFSADFLSDTCYQVDTDRIVSQWERLEAEYRKRAWEELIENINQDSVLKNDFFENDSALFKDLELFVQPILKLTEQAKNYQYGDYLCDKFVFDTVNYDMVASFCIDDYILFLITRERNDCDVEKDIDETNDGTLRPGTLKKDLKSKFKRVSGRFHQFYYKNGHKYPLELKGYSITPKSKIKNIKSMWYYTVFEPNIYKDFSFFVDGLPFILFKVIPKLGKYHLEVEYDLLTGGNDAIFSPNKLVLYNVEAPIYFTLREKFKEHQELIRNAPCDCPVGGKKKKWWQFWK